MCDACVWICDKSSQSFCYWYCTTCGKFSHTQPLGWVEMEHEDNIEKDEKKESQNEKCKHVWECLRDRCHNRGKGKYMAYKCTLCGKFQRR